MRQKWNDKTAKKGTRVRPLPLDFSKKGLEQNIFDCCTALKQGVLYEAVEDLAVEV